MFRKVLYPSYKERMSQILFEIIRKDVYKEKEIQDVSLWSTDKKVDWIFDFKSKSFSRVFLREFAECFWKEIGARYGNHVQVGGMEIGAIPLVSGVLLLAKNDGRASGFYIRKSRKKNDLANLIEGGLSTETPIILVDDILNSGTTMRKQVEILKERGYRISAVFVCLRFRDKVYYQDLIDQGIEILSIFELNDLSAVLPVKNLPSRSPELLLYSSVYKITLTQKPNLYRVESKSAPVLADDFLYIGTDDGTFYCLGADDGSVVWTYRILFGRHGRRICSMPVVFENKIIFGSYDGNIYCLDRFSGKREWVFMDADWVGSSPCIDDEGGIVYVGLGFGLLKKQGGMAALDAKTGKALWKYYQMPGLTYASPAYSKRQRMVVCGCEDGFFYAFDSKKGRLLWKFKTSGSVRQGAVFDEERKLIIFGSMDGGVYVLHSETGMLYRRFEGLFGFCSTPIVTNRYIIIGSLDRRVYCFDLVSRKTVWIFETSGRIFSSPVLDRESIFIGSNDGILYELDIYGGRLLSKTQFSERIVDRVFVSHRSDGRREIYIPTHACELYKVREYSGRDRG